MKIQLMEENKHLTTKDIESIKLILKNGLMAGKIGRTTWQILERNGPYLKIAKTLVDRGLGFVGDEKRVSTYTYKIKVTE